MRFQPCHAEPVRTPAWESVSFAKGKRIAAAPLGPRHDRREAFCSAPLFYVNDVHSHFAAGFFRDTVR